VPRAGCRTASVVHFRRRLNARESGLLVSWRKRLALKVGLGNCGEPRIESARVHSAKEHINSVPQEYTLLQARRFAPNKAVEPGGGILH
jgi:hypothetical protein